ncbi:Alpha/Beta hydrolase protein [Mycena belliarum]|uniref:Alpha/Beta hydrolase protein n=1 Tax=Mycena belliarum TaxID=1033014 RepID=A0AAD6XRY1_9AGAR|nr:Alpha/Beta hydrolase protein [Mycena belliae]
MPSSGVVLIASPSGPLELLTCIPQRPTAQPPLLFVHGSNCSAACFRAFLPLIASAGYACYAVSLRGHGKSWQPNAFSFHALTGLNAYVADVEAALAHLETAHPDAAPVLLGHSMGGSVLQHALTVWEAQRKQKSWRRTAGLVLLASGPLWGGTVDIARKWQAADAALAKAQSLAPASVPTSPPAPIKGWIPWLQSFAPKSGIHTPEHVRNKFFSAEASEDAVNSWFRDSKSRMESIRVSISMCWPIAEPRPVLAAIGRDAPPTGRKVLCIAAEKDCLITADVSKRNFDAYQSVCEGEEEVLFVELPGSAHHLMLDIARDRCADTIVAWLQGMHLKDVKT